MRVRPDRLVVPFYVLAALALTWPLARLFGSSLPVVVPGDALIQAFLLGWDWHALTTHPLGVFHAPIFHPEVRTLTYSDSLLGEAVLAGPLTAGFGIAVAYNSLVLVSFVASAYLTYRLARYCGISREGAFLAGFLFAFCPYRFSNLGGLSQLQTEFLPLGLLLGARFLERGHWKYGIGAAATLVVQIYFGWYGTYHLLIALGVLLIWKGGRSRSAWGRFPWTRIIVLGGVSLLLAAPGYVPYLEERMATPEFRRSLGSTALWSADLLDYLHVNPANLLAHLVPSLGDPQGLFPGLVAVVLAALAVRLRRVRYFPVMGLTGLVLSLGPVLQVGGHRLPVPLPFALFFYVIPGFASMRAPVRFAVLVALAAAVLAGAGLDRLRRRYPRHSRAILIGSVAAATLLAWNPGTSFFPVPDRSSIPPVYAWLSAQPDSLPVLELPMPPDEAGERTVDALRQVYVLYHGKPRLDGVSGFVSSRYEAFRAEMQAFPSPESVRAAYGMGARRLIVHYGDYAPGVREEVRRRAGALPTLHEEIAFGDDVVYTMTAPAED